MITVEKQLATVALGLSPRKRARLAELILESLKTKRETEIAELWTDEAVSRLNAFKQGRLKAVSTEKAFGFSV